MSFMRWTSCLRSVTLSVGVLGATSIRHSSTAYILRSPPRSAPREVPTPLVFVSASKWDPHSQLGMRIFASMFAERGFTCLEIDLAPPETAATSESLMQHFEDELTSHICLAAIPFPPVIVARESGALIAQTYVSSHPASGLLLISPPTSNAALAPSPSPSSPSAGRSTTTQLLLTPLREFDFEPKFPCAVMCAEGGTARLAENRLWRDPAVDKLVVRDSEALVGQDAFVRIEQWLDEIGI